MGIEPGQKRSGVVVPAAWQVDATTRLNVHWLSREVAWAGVSGGVVMSFLSIFALRLGASAFAVGLLTTGPALVGIVLPVPAARLVAGRWGKRIVVLPLALNRIVFAVLVCVPLAPSPVRVPLLVAAVALSSVPGVVFATGFVPLLAKVLPPEIRAHVIGVRSMVAGLTSTLTTLVVGKLLDVLPFPLNFQIVFVLCLVTAQMSTLLVSRVHVPALNETTKPVRDATRRDSRSGSPAAVATSCLLAIHHQRDDLQLRHIPALGAVSGRAG